MKKVREVIAYKNYFENFLKEQPEKVQSKIFKVIEAIETLERVPENYLKAISGTKGLYEARISQAKKSVFDDYDDNYITDIQYKINRRPREKLKFESPKNIFFNLVN